MALDDMKGEDCLKKTIQVDGDNVYVTVGLEAGGMVSGRFENRADALDDNDMPISREGAEKINGTITELLGILTKGTS